MKRAAPPKNGSARLGAPFRGINSARKEGGESGPFIPPGPQVADVYAPTASVVPLNHGLTLRERHLQEIRREGKFAIYEVRNDAGVLIGYEVITIRVLPGRFTFGKFYPAREAYPSSEQFGRYAWAYGFNHLKIAEAHFDALLAGKKFEVCHFRCEQRPDLYTLEDRAKVIGMEAALKVEEQIKERRRKRNEIADGKLDSRQK